MTFKYDPFGRRIGKQVTDTDGGTTTVRTTAFLYDAEDIVYEFVDVTVNGVPQPQVATHYVHGPGIDEPLALVRNGQPSYYHADGLGSIVAMTDASGNIVQRYSYEAFGQLTASDPAFDNFYTYTGREYDRETGLYYYRARYYDAVEGRFISKDPIGFAGGDVNLFNYVGGNPINYVDPSGLIGAGLSGGGNVTFGTTRRGFHVEARFAIDESKAWHDLSAYSVGLGYTIDDDSLCTDPNRPESSVFGLDYDFGTNVHVTEGFMHVREYEGASYASGMSFSGPLPGGAFFHADYEQSEMLNMDGSQNGMIDHSFGLSINNFRAVGLEVHKNIYTKTHMWWTSK